MAGVRIGPGRRAAWYKRVTDWEELKDAFWAAVDCAPADQARQIGGAGIRQPGTASPGSKHFWQPTREASHSSPCSSPSRPATQPPERIGPYEVIGALGVGGMGEGVPRARFALQRDVAIKVLPADVTNDPERLARFEREAQVLASLNHPHIAQVYGLEESGSTPALVMELVEGPTLALGDRGLARRAPGALTGSRDRAADRNGLEAAHEKGIIHRDLKPATSR